MVLHNYQPDYIDEVVQDAMLDLNGFEARSEFSTWFHWLALNKFRRLFRQRIQRKEVPLSQEDEPVDNNLFPTVFAKEIIEILRMRKKNSSILDSLKDFRSERLRNIWASNIRGVIERWVWLQKRLRDKYGVRK